MLEMWLLMSIASVTQRIRHMLARKLAPKFHDDYVYSLLPRPMTKFVKQTMDNKALIGVEIGVSQAHNSLSILKTLNMQKLYLIDPYVSYQEGNDRLVKISNAIKREAYERMKPFQDKVEWIYLSSEDAVNFVPNGLDFVYIDGNHSYPYVKKDIELYYEKVRIGGILGGHDFTLRYFPDVCYAVIEFARARNVRLFGDVADWWIIKK